MQIHKHVLSELHLWEAAICEFTFRKESMAFAVKFRACGSTKTGLAPTLVTVQTPEMWWICPLRSDFLPGQVFHTAIKYIHRHVMDSIY
jgi:hypothetical protein